MKFNIVSSKPKKGYANVSGHHGELLQGMFEHHGKLERGLVTVPCTRYVTTASFFPDNSSRVRVSPVYKTKAQKAAKLMLERCGQPGLGGNLVLHSNVPVKRGLGSSTQDTVASIKAVADSIDYDINAKDVIRMAVEIETASDPLLYESSVLFAQRKAEVIEDFYTTLPRFAIIGFSTDKNGVDTVNMPLPEYSQSEIAEFYYLRYLIKKGIITQDHKLIAEAATGSAVISQKYLPKPSLKEIIEITRDSGGLGIQISHSGSVVGCLFHPDDFNEIVMDKTTVKLSELGFRHFYHFNT